MKMFSRQDVIEMVDAVFHEFASSYRTEAKESIKKMMDRREGIEPDIQEESALQQPGLSMFGLR